jgi:hypothetical protein
MRALSLRSIPAALAVLAALAPQAAWCTTHYSRQITVGSGLFLGLMRDHPQKGTVTVTRADGKPVGKLTFAGSFVEFPDKGTYNLDFEGDDFDLQFAIVKSRESTGAYMLNVARTANGLRTTGTWEGDKEGQVTVNEKNGPLIVVD